MGFLKNYQNFQKSSEIRDSGSEKVGGLGPYQWPNPLQRATLNVQVQYYATGNFDLIQRCNKFLSSSICVVI